MTLPKYLTTITPFSKCLALVLFILLPFFGFYMGIQYQKLYSELMPSYDSRDAIESKRSALSGNTSQQVNTQIIYRPLYVENSIPVPDIQTVVTKTALWNTYKNTEFSFKYPSDWEVIDLLEGNKNLDWLKTTTLFIGIRPKTLTYDTLADIRVTTDSVETISKSDFDLTQLIKEHNEKVYLLDGNYGGDERLNLIYSTFRFIQ